MKYEGVCYGSGAGLVGLLVSQSEDGWDIVASYLGSNEVLAATFIGLYFEERKYPADDDTYEWIGLLSLPDIEARFGWAKS